MKNTGLIQSIFPWRYRQYITYSQGSNIGGHSYTKYLLSRPFEKASWFPAPNFGRGRTVLGVVRICYSITGQISWDIQHVENWTQEDFIWAIAEVDPAGAEEIRKAIRVGKPL